MTAAQLTDQEVWQRLQGVTGAFSPQALEQAEQVLVDLGVLADRSEAAVSNANIVLGYFNSQRHIPMDALNLRAVVKAFADKLFWTSQTAKRYFLLGLSDSEATLIQKWLEQGPGRLLIGEGAEGQANVVALVNYCRKVGGVDWQNLSKGLEVLNPMSPGVNAPQLHWKTVTPPGGFTNRTGFPDHSENYKPEEKKEETRQYIHGRKNHAWVDPNQPTAPKVQDPNEGGGWRNVCEALAKDGHHSDQAELSAVMQRARTDGKSWQETYQLMQQVKKDRHGFRARV